MGEQKGRKKDEVLVGTQKVKNSYELWLSPNLGKPIIMVIFEQSLDSIPELRITMDNIFFYPTALTNPVWWLKWKVRSISLFHHL